MWTLFLARLTHMSGQIANGNTIPADKIPSMLAEAWHFRHAAHLKGDIMRADKWDAAVDTLLDQWLEQRPELRCELVS